MSGFPPRRFADETDDEFTQRSEESWAALSVDAKLDWASGHDIRMIEVDGTTWDVRTRSRLDPPA